MDVDEALRVADDTLIDDTVVMDKALAVLAAEVRQLRDIEARVRTTARRPQGHGEKAADYRQARRLACFFLGEA